MTPEAAAARLEAVLRQENAALAACDAVAATAFLAEKLEAARHLSATGVSLETAARLRALAAENRRLLEHAIRVQSRILAMVANAARQAPSVSRYGAKGRTVADKGPLAFRQQA